MPPTDTTPPVAPSDLFPVALPNGEQGTIFLRFVVTTPSIEDADRGREAFLGPFETVEDASITGERIAERPSTVSYDIVGADSITSLDRYYPVDREFMANEDVVEAIEYALYQSQAALATGDYEQWRNKPDEAAALRNWRSRAERAAEREAEKRSRAQAALTKDIKAYRRVQAMLDAGEITQADIDAAE